MARARTRIVKVLTISHRCIWSNKISPFTFRDNSQRGESLDRLKVFQVSKNTAIEENSELYQSKSKQEMKKSSSCSSFSSSWSSSSLSSFFSSSSESKRATDSIGKQRVSSIWIHTPLGDILILIGALPLYLLPSFLYQSDFLPLVTFFVLLHFPGTSASHWISVAVAVFAYWKSDLLVVYPFPSLLPVFSFIPAFPTYHHRIYQLFPSFTSSVRENHHQDINWEHRAWKHLIWPRCFSCNELSLKPPCLLLLVPGGERQEMICFHWRSWGCDVLLASGLRCGSTTITLHLEVSCQIKLQSLKTC